MLAKSYVEAPNKFRVFTVNIFNDLSIDNNKRGRKKRTPPYTAHAHHWCQILLTGSRILPRFGDLQLEICIFFSKTLQIKV